MVLAIPSSIRSKSKVSRVDATAADDKTTTITTIQQQNDDVQKLLQFLSDSEIETAARTCYHYATNASKQRSSSDRWFHAASMARRYLESAQQDQRKALERMRKTLEFRRARRVDELREALDDPLNYYHKELQTALSTGHVYVQGYDRYGRSTYIFLPRNEKCHELERVMASHLWTVEKAIACSHAKDKSINAVVDFSGFAGCRPPPLSVGKELVSTLRSHYVGHINKIWLVNAPTAFFCLWALLKPLAGKTTRSKIEFVSSASEKKVSIGKLYDENQAAPWMLPNGRKTRELDLDEYMNGLQFDEAFDE